MRHFDEKGQFDPAQSLIAQKMRMPSLIGWHGSKTKGLKKFDVDQVGGFRGDSSVLGAHFTTDSRLGRVAAGSYAGKNGSVYKVDLGGARLYPMHLEEYKSMGSARHFRQLRERLKGDWDGVRYPEGASQADEVAVWNTNKIRMLSEENA